jgi:hypothetical protein
VGCERCSRHPNLMPQFDGFLYDVDCSCGGGLHLLAFFPLTLFDACPSFLASPIISLSLVLLFPSWMSESRPLCLRSDVQRTEGVVRRKKATSVCLLSGGLNVGGVERGAGGIVIVCGCVIRRHGLPVASEHTTHKAVGCGCSAEAGGGAAPYVENILG